MTRIIWRYRYQRARHRVFVAGMGDDPRRLSRALQALERIEAARPW